VTSEVREKRISEVLLVGLTDRKDHQVKKYSDGMRRRLEIARGLIHKPKMIFLDEPTLGLDPASREVMWGYIHRLVKEERITIILTTHYMEEADFLCNRVGIIDKGKIIALDSPSRLKESLGRCFLLLFQNLQILLRLSMDVSHSGIRNLLLCQMHIERKSLLWQALYQN
jgi:ABC-2 type transport system ATP-binding protein